jgi:hypothetical protein
MCGPRRFLGGTLAVRVAVLAIASIGLTVQTSPARADAVPFPLGTYVQMPGTPPFCPVGFSCSNFSITSCPGVGLSAGGNMALAYPSSAPIRGVVMLFSGGGGEDWWAFGPGAATDFLTKLREQDGFVEVQVRWAGLWLNAAAGEQVGAALLACRPATVIRQVYDSVYVPLGLDPGPGVCGFCITGNSGGSSQVSYALSRYGLDSILDDVVPTEGPIHAGIWKGCVKGYPQYLFSNGERNRIDASYGYLSPSTDPGPCQLKDTSWTARWHQDAIDNPEADYSHPDTRVEFITGGLTGGVASSHGSDHRDQLLQDPANHVGWTVVTDMPHAIQSSQEGMDALELSLLGSIPMTPPDAEITSAPPPISSSASATFSFTSDVPGAAMTCSVDGGVPTSCVSPLDVPALADGAHTFAVQATYPVGNTGPAATWEWTVDTVAPAVTFTAGPSSPIRESWASFSFLTDDPAAAVTCALDGELPVPCTSPAGMTDLTDGDHTFTARATDTAGNVGASTWAWTVDTSLVLPGTTITSGPDPVWASAAATLTFVSDEQGVKFTCSVDGGPGSECVSPVDVSVPDGPHSFQVYATDANGSPGPAANRSWVVDTAPPSILSGGLQMLDINGNGRVDRVSVAFSEPLNGNGAGTSPWSLSGIQSGGTFAGVTVSGSTATLVIAEGPGPADTSVGAFTVALAADPAGIVDAAGNQASFDATQPTDLARPVRTALQMFDQTPVNGKVDRAVVSFSEPLAGSTATGPWTLSNVPSGGSLAAVSVSAAQATLSLSEGPGGTDTTVGGFTVSLAPDPAGIRDESGNETYFQAVAPADRAGPVPVRLTDTGGATNGKIQPGDTLTLTFSEPLFPSSIPISATVTMADPTTASTDQLTITGVTGGALDIGSDGYVTKDGRTATFLASPITAGNGNRSLIVRIGAVCSGNCSALAASSGPFTFVPAIGLRDPSANPASGSITLGMTRLF